MTKTRPVARRLIALHAPDRGRQLQSIAYEEAALEESLNQAAAGQFVDAEALLRELRQ